MNHDDECKQLKKERKRLRLSNNVKRASISYVFFNCYGIRYSNIAHNSQRTFGPHLPKNGHHRISVELFTIITGASPPSQKSTLTKCTNHLSFEETTITLLSIAWTRGSFLFLFYAIQQAFSQRILVHRIETSTQTNKQQFPP